MAVYTLRRTQRLPITGTSLGVFFLAREPERNYPALHGLSRHLRSRFLSKMYPGQVITYTVTPLLGIPLFWMTEITHVEEGRYFVDEQRVGPYSIWHHQHHFTAIPGGVEMTDLGCITKYRWGCSATWPTACSCAGNWRRSFLSAGKNWRKCLVQCREAEGISRRFAQNRFADGRRRDFPRFVQVNWFEISQICANLRTCSAQICKVLLH